MRQRRSPLRAETTPQTVRARKLSTARSVVRTARPPKDLRRFDLRLGDEHFVVLSHVSEPEPVLMNLSPSESAVARAAAAGLTNAEIAANRGCSRFTIQNQLASIYKKLGVSSRAELAALLARQGPR